MLAGLGATKVDLAASTREALRLIEAAPPAFAVPDVNLGTETSLPVARRLAELGIRYVFATGYGESFRIPAGMEDVAVVKKPYAADILAWALAG